MGLMKTGNVQDLVGQGKEVQLVVEEALRNSPEKWYTIMGLMTLKFGVKDEDILGIPFYKMKREHAFLYGRIDRCLKKLVKEGKVNKTKNGKAFVYWWKS